MKLVQLPRAPDQTVRRNGKPPRTRGLSRWCRKFGVVSEDPALKVTKRRTRLESELLAKMLARRRIHLERFRLTSAAIEREHLERTGSFAQRM